MNIRYLLFFFASVCCIKQNQAQHLDAWQIEETQNYLDFFPCGSPNDYSNFRQAYKADPQSFKSSARNTIYFPITIHNVGNDNGSGFSSFGSIISAFCQLNQDYAGTGIQFFIQDSIRTIYNSDFNDHDSVIIGGGYMLSYNVPNTLNIYFVSNPSGNCGYNLPYAGVAMGNACLGGHTFAHEVGHALTLQHTFLGWEGGPQWNSSTQTSFSGPAPDSVTYNYTFYKDTMWKDTLIIDTTEVEYVTRTGPKANCAHAADGFCDTEADYLAFRWSCNNLGQSAIQQYDPDTVAFFSKGANIMSYADDACQSIITTEQADQAKAFIQNRRSSYLFNQNPIRDSVDINDFVAVSPLVNEVLPQTTGLEFKWNSIPGATHYIVTVNQFPALSTPIEEIITTDTSFISFQTYTPRSGLFPYTWRVQAFNQGYHCGGATSLMRFNTSIPSDLRSIAAFSSITLYPTLINNATPLQLEINAQEDSEITLSIYNVLGQVISRNQTMINHGLNQLQISSQALEAGSYILEIQKGTERVNKRFNVLR